MNALVIEPGHGSLWLMDAEYNEDGSVTGWTWDDTGTGSPLMPDDYGGERLTLTFPANLILRTEPVSR